MEFITWTEDYSVKNETIDQQHKKLLNIINQLYYAMENGESRLVMNTLFTQLQQYTVNHFETEERLLILSGYRDIDEHRIMHDHFRHKVIQYQNEFDNGKLVVSVDVMGFLKNWLSTHILGEDQQYVECLQKYTTPSL